MTSTRTLSWSPYFPRDYGNNLSDDFGTIPELDAEQVHAAVLKCCLAGTDTDEVREFLEMCGYPL